MGFKKANNEALGQLWIEYIYIYINFTTNLIFHL